MRVSGAVDTGGYEWPSPWDDPAWQLEVTEWIQNQLHQIGLAASEEEARVRLRPWSVILRVPLKNGQPVWFKANPPGSSFEPALSSTIHRLAPHCTLEPLAVNTDRSWALTADGGEVLAERMVVSGAVNYRWEDALRQYSELQKCLADHSEELLSLGVPDFRPETLGQKILEVMSYADKLGIQDRRNMQSRVARFQDQCAILEEAGIPASLEHGDLHPSQVLVNGHGGYTFFDWGDASIGHPFASFLRTVRTVLRRLSQAEMTRALEAASVSYLEPWADMGLDAQELRAVLNSACSVGTVAKALASGRIFASQHDEARSMRLSEVMAALEEGGYSSIVTVALE